ncbi:MAG TPA: hypothetical protein VMA86_01635 [Acetobacteraceae bacterium]|nr:hypothetical protein [Acetobacteraceae bacterium]
MTTGSSGAPGEGASDEAPEAPADQRRFLLDGKHPVRIGGGESFGLVKVVRVEGGDELWVAFERLSEVRPEADPAPPLMAIGAAEWERAQTLVQTLAPLANRRRTSAEIEEACRALSLKKSQVYAGLDRMRTLIRTNQPIRVSDFVPKKSDGGKGGTRLDSKIVEIMDEVFGDFHDTNEKPSPAAVIDEVRSRCLTRGVPQDELPADNTVRKFLEEWDGPESTAKRLSPAAAEQRFGAAAGHFPYAEEALDCVLIDHTMVDVVVVSEEERKPIGRPWLTLGIDAGSRALPGWNLSLDPPSALSVALCCSCIVSRKEAKLKELGIDARYRIFGVPKMLHADNAKEFKTGSLTRAAEQHGFHIKWRPVRQPKYGGLIERVIGTTMGALHLLPGTTFSNVQEKGDYDPAKHACFTLKELERYLVHWIVTHYHLSPHGREKIIPRSAWERSFFDAQHRLRRPLPREIDADEFLIDLLPGKSLTFQRYGFQWDYRQYFDPALEHLIGRKDEHGEKPYYWVTRDPRNVLYVFFRHPDSGAICRVPDSDPSATRKTAWELEAEGKEDRARVKREFDEVAVLHGVAERSAMRDEAKKKTRGMRDERERERSRQARRARTPTGKGAKHPGDAAPAYARPAPPRPAPPREAAPAPAEAAEAPPHEWTRRSDRFGGVRL